MSRNYRVAYVTIGILWVACAFVHLYFFSLPWMDSWCYLAPSVVDAHAGRLTEPFLGNFRGADQAWGLQWPGVLLFNSLIFSFLPFDPVLLVAFDVLLWLGSAAMLAALVVHASRSPALGLFAYVLVLMDRAFFFIAYAHRMEFLALIALVPLVWIMVNRSSSRPSSVAAEVVATICSLAAPMFHPAAALAAGFILLVALRRAYVQKLSVRWSLTHLASYLLGAVTFASWLYLQPFVLEQFRDHAARAAATYPMGTLFVRAMPLFYAPTFTGVFVYGLGLVAAAFALSGAVRRLAPQSVIAPKMMTDLAAASLGSLLAFHILRNPYYTTLLLPLLLPLGMAFALGVWPLLPRVSKPLLIAVAVGFLTLHGAFWVTRTAKFAQDHFANLRAELDVFWATLPAGQQRLFVPEVLWEAAAKDSGRRVRTMMNTLPHAATLERRAAYEAYAYGMATKGDLLIVDAFQSNRILTEIDPALWEPVSRVSRPLPGKTPWGFELITYRRRQ